MKHIIASTLLLGITPLSASSIIPDLTTPSTDASGWEFRAALYGWATQLDGDVTVGGRTASMDVGFDDILDSLDFSFMGALEVSKGPWSFMSDLFYAELSADNTVRRLTFDAELKQFTGNFVITRNVIDDSDSRFDVYAGARVMAMDNTLTITRNGIIRRRTFTGSASESWVDPVIGFRAQQDFPNRFFVRALGDIGGFGVASDLTWQAMLGLGYQIDDCSAVMLGYRGLGEDYENGAFGYDVVSHGLILGYERKF